MSSMPDPFEALRTAPTPIDPARLARALSNEGDTSMTLNVAETADRLRTGDMSFLSLWIRDLERGARFYADVLGWKYASPSDSYARLVEGQSMSLGLGLLGASTAYIRGLGVPLPATTGPSAYVVFVVEQLESAIERVRAAGGVATEPKDQPYGRVSACMDNQGLGFTLHEVLPSMPAPRPAQTGQRQGDVAYVSFGFPDGDLARAFYSSVFGVHF
jgi:uncharacterized protein